MYALFGRGARHVGDEAAATKDGAHEGVVEFPPVVVDGASGCREKHAQAARADCRLLDSISPSHVPGCVEELGIRILTGKKRHGEGLGRARL